MEFKEKNTINIPTNYKTFVYFLIKNNEVIYVGQTNNNLCRPFSHKNKDFDRVEIMLCRKEDLDFLEDKYILKYKPKYNNKVNDGYKISTARDKLRRTFGKKLTIRHIKKAMKELNIDYLRINGKEYITNDMALKIGEKLKKTWQYFE